DIVKSKHATVIAFATHHYLEPSQLNPSRAACEAIIVEQQAAMDALKNQPGLGDEPSPPIDLGILVSSCSPLGPVTRHRSPSTSQWRKLRVPSGDRSVSLRLSN